MKTWLICFDISDDSTRRPVVKLLQAHGLRVQKSVFEVSTNSREQLQKLQADLTDTIDEFDDVRIYRLCAECREKSINLQGGPIADFPLAVVL